VEIFQFAAAAVWNKSVDDRIKKDE